MTNEEIIEDLTERIEKLINRTYVADWKDYNATSQTIAQLVLAREALTKDK